jgi:hypothetical protein
LPKVRLQQGSKLKKNPVIPNFSGDVLQRKSPFMAEEALA